MKLHVFVLEFEKKFNEQNGHQSPAEGTFSMRLTFAQLYRLETQQKNK